MEKIVQTAGRDQLGGFAPAFAHFNDDVLFGENWNDGSIDHKTRCVITVVALISSGMVDSSLSYHLQNAKNAGVSREEIAAVITNTAFYAGWPKAWAAFNQAKEIWPAADEASDGVDGQDGGKPASASAAFDKDAGKAEHEASMVFPVGAPNDAYARYFTGQSYLAPVSTEQVGVFNVTFEPACRNNWHVHRAKRGGGQILLCVGGRGFYQEWGCDPVQMLPGDCVNIPVGVKHWHGAAPDSWFSHLAIEVPGEETSNEWLEPVDDEAYAAATGLARSGE